jgi:uncharacterized membrane protein YidH (DUF202 family)
MDSDRKSAILTGVFFIVGTALGLVGLGVVLQPLLDAPDSLTAYGTMESRVLVASLLELLMGVSLVAMAIAVYPVLRKFSPAAAAAYLSSRVLEAVVYILSVVSMLALVEVGKQYVEGGSSDASYDALGAALLGVSDWAGHVVLDVAIFPLGAAVLYWVFFRAGLVPKWLAGWGLVGAFLYWLAGLLVMFDVVVPLEGAHIALQAPLGVQEMVLALWLIIKGFGASARVPVSSAEEAVAVR